MRIAFVVGGFPRLSETFIIDQVTGLIDRGHDVEIFAYEPAGPPLRNDAVDAYRLLDRTRYYFRTWSTPRDVTARTLRLLRRDPRTTLDTLARSLDARTARDPLSAFGTWPLASMALESQRFDVVLAHFGPHGVLADRVRALGVLRAPLVTSFLGKDLSAVIKARGGAFYRNLFARGELMLPCTRSFRDRLVELGCPSDRVLVHRMGIDLRSFQAVARERRAGDRVRLLSVVRLVEKKGIEFGLRALALALKSFEGFAWDIIGDDGPLLARIRGLIVELGLTDHVVLHSPMSRARVREMLASADIFLAPSVTAANGDQEGLPVAIVEAMACGLPVVSTVHSGIPELVEHGVTGYLVPEWDVAALSESLWRLAREPESWAPMGRRGREIAVAEYDVNRLNDTLSDLLGDVARGARFARSDAA